MSGTPKLFVVGCARSGTTWVRSILSEHPYVVGGAESHLFPILYAPIVEEVDPPRRRARALAAYDERYERRDAFGDTGPHRWVDRRTLEQLLDDASGMAGQDAARHVIGGALESFFAARRGVTGTVLVEKTPVHLMYGHRILGWWPEARIIELVRDGRDVCVSLEHKSRVRSWAPTERTRQIEQWVGAVKKGMYLRAQPYAAQRWQVVRYEDLSADPKRTIGNLYEFAGLPADADLLSRVVEATSFANVQRPGAEHHVRRGEVGGWREQFSDEDLKEFERLAGDVFAEAGYEW